MKRDTKIIVLIILIMLAFNIVSFYTINFRLEDIIGAQDILMKAFFGG